MSGKCHLFVHSGSLLLCAASWALIRNALYEKWCRKDVQVLWMYPRWSLPSKWFVVTGSMRVRILRISWSVFPIRWIPEAYELWWCFAARNQNPYLFTTQSVIHGPAPSSLETWVGVPAQIYSITVCVVTNPQAIHVHIKIWEHLPADYTAINRRCLFDAIGSPGVGSSDPVHCLNDAIGHLFAPPSKACRALPSFMILEA